MHLIFWNYEIAWVAYLIACDVHFGYDGNNIGMR
jgi:hypothetical protein